MLAGLIAMAASCAPLSLAADTAEPSLEMQGMSVGLLVVGGNGGTGTLTFEGRTYSFAFWGVTEGGVAANTFVATGTVHGLIKLEDFSGYYRPTTRDVLVPVGSVSTVTMRNGSGVTINLVSSVQGLNVGVAWGAIDIDMSGNRDHAYEQANSE